MKALKILIYFLGCTLPLVGQDALFTQFYAAPLYLNPAFAGSVDCWRMGMNTRTQWTLGPKPYSTYMASVDYNKREWRTGFGGYVMYDRRGSGHLQTYEIAPMVAHRIQINPDLQFRLGLQPSYHLKYAIGGGYTFGDQYTNREGLVSGTTDGPNIVRAMNFFDLSTGALLIHTRWWLGLAVHHLLRNPLLTDISTERVPLKAGLHGGYKIVLNEEENITWASNLRYQGASIQNDLGFYYDRKDIVMGLWYRGIPLRVRDNTFNHDALAFLIGYRYYSLWIGYSYDLPLTRLIASYGSHELSILFEFCTQGKRKPPRNVQQLPCPKF